MKYQGIIFDLDGTLLYTLGDLRTAMNAMLAEKGFPLQDDNGILASINSGAKEFVRHCLPLEWQKDEAVIADAFTTYQKYYRIHYTDSSLPYPGVSDVVANVGKAGMPAAVFSNKSDFMTKGLVKQRFPEDSFAIALGHADDPSDPLVFPHKPSPEGAHYIAREIFHADPARVVLVGDSDVDVALGLNAGMDVIGVSWGYRKPELLLEKGAAAVAYSAEELQKLLLA